MSHVIQRPAKIFLASPSQTLFRELAIAGRIHGIDTEITVAISDFSSVQASRSYLVALVDIDRLDVYGPQVVSEIASSVRTNEIVVATGNLFPGFVDQLHRAGASRVLTGRLATQRFLSYFSSANIATEASVHQTTQHSCSVRSCQSRPSRLSC